MRIAIEIDNIVRDNNSQALKYYRKGFDPSFDEEVDLNCTDLLSILPFPSKESRSVFKEIDYPYELFGCANTCYKHLHVELEDWLEEHEDDEIIYFALDESRLMIQSTYFFLSKGSRVRTVIFPKNPEEIWKYCDVAITINKGVIDSKPEDKKVILIKKSDNTELLEKADMVYESLIDLLRDEDFMKSNVNNQKVIETNKNKEISIFGKIKEKIFNFKI